MAKIIPGILTADEKEYQQRLTVAEHSADLIQIDIVDGIFSPNKTIQTDTVKKYETTSSLEIQLMVSNPLKYIDDLINIKYVTRIIFPLETNYNVNENIYRIKKSGKQAGLSLNPETAILSAYSYFETIDVLLLMTGKPGYSGQKLGKNTYARIKESKSLDYSLPVEIDIGVNFENARKLSLAGADFLVASSTLFNSPDFFIAFEKLSKLATIIK